MELWRALGKLGANKGPTGEGEIPEPSYWDPVEGFQGLGQVAEANCKNREGDSWNLAEVPGI